MKLTHIMRLYRIVFYCKKCGTEWSEELWVTEGHHPADLTEYACQNCDDYAEAVDYTFIADDAIKDEVE